MDDITITNVKKQAFIAKRKAETVAPSMDGADSASRAWRSEQAQVDADIESLASDPVVEAMMEDMRRDLITPEEMRARLHDHFGSNPAVSAAE